MFTSLIELFYPQVCAGCESILLPFEPVICSRCRHEIPQTDHLSDPKNEAMVKFYGRVPVEFAAAFLHYHKKGIVQQLIHNLKYKGMEAVGAAIAGWCADPVLESKKFESVDYVIPVPLHPKKLRKRGYNQVEQFARTLSGEMNISYNDRLLYRKIYSNTQTKKNLLGRTELKSEIFDVHTDPDMNGKHFLIVDDVLTTGSTLEACIRAILKIPGSKVSIFCMAMSH